MKNKLTRRVPALAAITALMLGIGATAHAGDQKNTTNPPTALTTAIIVDPNTPVGTALPQWIDPDWKDSGVVIPEVYFDLPLAEVARQMRDKFKDAFDIVIPRSWQNPNDQTKSVFDPTAFDITLQLKNVTATEIFNAMNLVFETENTPVRWELKMNGNRPLALLRVVPALIPHPAGPPEGPPRQKRMIFFVGDLVGNEKSGGMTTMEQLFNTVCQVYDMGYDRGSAHGDIKFHNEAQLLIVTASADKIDFVENTLAALRQKERISERTAVDFNTKSEAPKKAKAATEPNK